jgi:L-glutamine-phosphate cytidylyltransferase
MPLTKNTPKPLIDFGDGSTLLEKQIKNILESQVIDEIVLVVGYLAEQIEAKIKTYQEQGIKIKTIYNPFYSESNNLVSLWFAKEEFNSDTLITNGDNIFSSNVFKDLVNYEDKGIYLSISKKEQSQYTPGDMKVCLEENNLICNVSKELAAEDTDAESPGLVKISGKRYLSIYKNILDQLIRKKESKQQFWLETFNTLHRQGINVEPFEINGAKDWHEVDFHLDLNNVQKLIKDKINPKQNQI